MMCNMFGGEILNEFEIGDFERSPPLLFLYLSLFKENKSGKKKGLYRFWTPASLNFIESKNITISSTNFYFIYILFYINFDVFIYYFYFIINFSFHGKLNKMGNTAGWRHEANGARGV